MQKKVCLGKGEESKRGGKDNPSVGEEGKS